MTYKRFEDLPVSKAAIEFALRVFALVEDKRFASKGDLRNQLQRASVSIGNNIAEGFERGTTPELLTFLYISRGSAGECRSMLTLCERLPDLDDLRSEISDLRSQAESIARQIRAWADRLQNSPIKGQRYLNERTRVVDEQDRRAAAFWAKLEEQQRQRLEAWSREGKV
jgi:four helix bundle protein